MHLYIEVGVEIHDRKHTIVKHRSKAVMGTGILLCPVTTEMTFQCLRVYLKVTPITPQTHQQVSALTLYLLEFVLHLSLHVLSFHLDVLQSTSSLTLDLLILLILL